MSNNTFYRTVEVIGRCFCGEDEAEKIILKSSDISTHLKFTKFIDAMSEKSGRNKKRSKPTSASKTKRLKASDWVDNEEISEENNCPKDIMKVNKLVTVSQPILRNSQKIKLKALLSNWKPPLKNKHNENHEVCNTKTDTVQESEMKVLKCEDTVSETKQIQTISPSSSEESEKSEFERVESSFGNDNYHVNNTLEQKSSQQHQESYNVHEPSTSLNQVSESTIYDTHMTNATFDFNEQKSKDIFAHDINSKEVIIKNKNCDSKSQEDSLNEQVNIPCAEACTPEVTRTPPPPTLKISNLNSNVGNDLSPSNSKNLIPNEACEELLNLNKKSPKESNTYNKTELLDNKKVNSSELLTMPKKSELQTSSKYPVANSFESECELDLSILHTQLYATENNPSTLDVQKELPQERNASRELAQEFIPPRERTQDSKNIDFTPFHPTAFTPKMPRINWVLQLQEDKRKLQVVVREISQLNAMLTRAIREIWPERLPH